MIDGSGLAVCWGRGSEGQLGGDSTPAKAGPHRPRTNIFTALRREVPTPAASPFRAPLLLGTGPERSTRRRQRGNRSIAEGSPCAPPPPRSRQHHLHHPRGERPGDLRGSPPMDRHGAGARATSASWELRRRRIVRTVLAVERRSPSPEAIISRESASAAAAMPAVSPMTVRPGAGASTIRAAARRRQRDRVCRGAFPVAAAFASGR